MAQCKIPESFTFGAQIRVAHRCLVSCASHHSHTRAVSSPITSPDCIRKWGLPLPTHPQAGWSYLVGRPWGRCCLCRHTSCCRPSRPPPTRRWRPPARHHPRPLRTTRRRGSQQVGWWRRRYCWSAAPDLRCPEPDTSAFACRRRFSRLALYKGWRLLYMAPPFSIIVFAG